MIRYIVAILVLITISKPAFAYIDAALGGLVLQGLVAGFVSIMVLWRGWIDKVKSFLSRKRLEDTLTSEQSDGK
jgi:hypothetical protein